MSDINRLLVVDDQADILEFIATVAELVGYRVATAQNAERAFALLREFDPSLVILDLQMPDVDGVELIRQLATYGTRAPILISSGMDPRVLASVEQLGLTQGLNMIGTLQKPLALLLNAVHVEAMHANASAAAPHDGAPGIGAPVMIRTAVPGRQVWLKGAPGSASPTTVNGTRL